MLKEVSCENKVSSPSSSSISSKYTNKNNAVLKDNQSVAFVAYREFTRFEANIKPSKFSLFQCEERILSSLYDHLRSAKRHLECF